MLFASVLWAQSGGIITTVARNGTGGDTGDGVPSPSAYLEGPTGVAVENLGNTYITDTAHNRVRNAAGVAAPSSSSNGVANGASFGATIQGTNLATSTGEWDVGDGILPITVNDVTVDFGGNDAYICYVSPTQSNFIVPDVRTGLQQQVTVDNFGPAFFPFFPCPNNQVVATYLHCSYAAASGTFTGVTTAAVKPGDTIILWATGFGSTSPAFTQGMVTPATGSPYTTDPVSVTIDNLPATVYGAALAPGFAGLYQIAIQVPNALGAGKWPVVATIGGVSAPTGPVLAVQQ